MLCLRLTGDVLTEVLTEAGVVRGKASLSLGLDCFTDCFWSILEVCTPPVVLMSLEQQSWFFAVACVNGPSSWSVSTERKRPYRYV